MSDDKLPFQIALEQIENVIKFKKCWKCGCNQGAIKSLEKELDKLSPADRNTIIPLIQKARSTFQPIEYDCLGCKTCYPGDLSNALSQAYPKLELEPDSCASEDIFVEAREGFPPFPGSYEVIRYQAPVAVCTLNEKDLYPAIGKSAHPAISIVGSLNTENLGIERVVQNTIANPNIRFLILCGNDSEQRIGHLPGQSLLSLFRNGVDENRRIVGAQGKRPVLKNVTHEEIQHFRKQVEVIDLIGCMEVPEILKKAEDCRTQGKSTFSGGIVMNFRVEPVQAKPPKALQLDPNGYFVIYPDSKSGVITVEHYKNTGVLNQIIKGRELGSIYMTIIEMGLISKLDHAAYLGKELARAEAALNGGPEYVQDQAQDSPEVSEAEVKRCGGTGCC